MTPPQKILSVVVVCIAAATVTFVALSLQTDPVTVPIDWHICRGTKYYALQYASNTSYVLDLKDGYLPNGAGVQLWPWVGGMNQVWFFDTMSNDGNDDFEGKPIFVRTLLNLKCLD